MTLEPTHSPLPWTTDSIDRIHDAKGNFLGYLNCGNTLTDEKNAQLVTAAVVTYKGLLAAAKMALKLLPECETACANILEEAIAAAEKDAP